MSMFKKSLLVGAGVLTIGLASAGGLGVASAATSTDSSSSTSIVDKIATKFGLNKAEVQAVFDEERSTHIAEMKADRTENLAAAVKDGTITQAQSDYITKALEAIDALHEQKASAEDPSDTRAAVKEKMDVLRDWMDEQGINPEDLGLGHGPGGRGGPGERGGSRDDSSNEQ